MGSSLGQQQQKGGGLRRDRCATLTLSLSLSLSPSEWQVVSWGRVRQAGWFKWRLHEEYLSPPSVSHLSHLGASGQRQGQRCFLSFRVPPPPASAAERNLTGLIRVQFSSVLFCSARFCSVRFSSTQFGSVRFSSAQFGLVRFGSVQFSSAQLSPGRYLCARKSPHALHPGSEESSY